jgi:hypothetical protein
MDDSSANSLLFDQVQTLVALANTNGARLPFVPTQRDFARGGQPESCGLRYRHPLRRLSSFTKWKSGIRSVPRRFYSEDMD